MPRLVECHLHHFFAFVVEGAGSLVQNQDLGISEKRSGYGDTLLLASAETRAAFPHCSLGKGKTVIWRRSDSTGRFVGLSVSWLIGSSDIAVPCTLYGLVLKTSSHYLKWSKVSMEGVGKANNLISLGQRGDEVVDVGHLGNYGDWERETFVKRSRQATSRQEIEDAPA